MEDRHKMNKSTFLDDVIAELSIYLDNDIALILNKIYMFYKSGDNFYVDALKNSRTIAEAIGSNYIEYTQSIPAISRNGNPKSLKDILSKIDNERLIGSFEFIKEFGNPASHYYPPGESSFTSNDVVSVLKHVIKASIVYIEEVKHKDDIVDIIARITKEHENKVFPVVDITDDFSEDGDELNEDNIEATEVESYNEKLLEQDKKFMNFIDDVNFDASGINLQNENSSRRNISNINISGVEVERCQVPFQNAFDEASMYVCSESYEKLHAGYVNDKENRVIVLTSKQKSGKKATAVKLLIEKLDKNKMIKPNTTDRNIKSNDRKNLFYINQFEAPITLKGLKTIDIAYSSSYIVTVDVKGIFGVGSDSDIRELNRLLEKKHSFMVIISDSDIDQNHFNKHYWNWEFDIAYLELVEKMIHGHSTLSLKRINKIIEELQTHRILEKMAENDLSPRQVFNYVEKIIEYDPFKEIFSSVLVEKLPIEKSFSISEFINNHKNDVDYISKIIILTLFKQMPIAHFNKYTDKFACSILDGLEDDELRKEYKSVSFTRSHDETLKEIKAEIFEPLISTNYSDIRMQVVRFKNDDFGEWILNEIRRNHGKLYDQVIEWIKMNATRFPRVMLKEILPAFKLIFSQNHDRVINNMIIPWSTQKIGKVDNAAYLASGVISDDQEKIIRKYIVKSIKSKNVSKRLELFILQVVFETFYINDSKFAFRTVELLIDQNKKMSGKDHNRYAYYLGKMLKEKEIVDDGYYVLTQIDSLMNTDDKAVYKALYVKLFNAQLFEGTSTMVELLRELLVARKQILPAIEYFLMDKVTSEYMCYAIYNNIRNTQNDSDLDFLRRALKMIIEGLKKEYDENNVTMFGYIRMFRYFDSVGNDFFPEKEWIMDLFEVIEGNKLIGNVERIGVLENMEGVNNEKSID